MNFILKNIVLPFKNKKVKYIIYKFAVKCNLKNFI